MPPFCAMNLPELTRPIAITPGDPCGIGPEIIARAWCIAPELTQGCFVAGDVGLMRRAMALVQSVVRYPVCEIETPAQALTTNTPATPSYCRPRRPGMRG
jgi:4-hydroxythreonine-4-phosphate dehydrogenase